MESITGNSNWKLTVRKEKGRMVILRAITYERRAVLPSEISGLPVTALENHALSPAASAAEGEKIEITCGPTPPDAEWNNSRLEDLRLPNTLEQVGDYAFFNCVRLKTLRLCDTVQYWGSGALMNCRVLDTIYLEQGTGNNLAYFAGELNRELDVILTKEENPIARLLFPEYMESYEENSPAHHFDYTIYGAGYPYHHCFRNRQLDWKEYDHLWRRYLGMEYETSSALRLAWWRLRYPLELSEKAEREYLGYMENHAGEAFRWLLKERDTAGLRFLLRRIRPDRKVLAEACTLARELNNTEAVAVLLEEQHTRVRVEPCFDL